VLSAAEQAVRMIEDPAGLTERITRVLAVTADAGDGNAVGLLGWTSGTRAEIARVDELRRAHPGPLLAVIEHPPTPRGARALASKLEGVVFAANIESALLPAVEAVRAGLSVVPRSLRALVHRPPLSPREKEILAMVVLDFSNAEIAAKLFVTESNVKNHLTSAFQKLGVKSRAEAAELILDNESGLGPGILRITPEDEELL